MSIQENDIKFMERAINLSLKGEPEARPNPLVGAVIVKNNKIIGEGYHAKYGEAHAEINAIQNAVEPVKGATIYVTLEPCSHHGKTPPCADRLIAEGFSRVVIGMADPNPLVNGKGIEKLKKAGIEVVTGILSNKVEKVNEIFIKNITGQLPFVVMKFAMTLDGKIATVTGDSKWISGEEARKYVHELRHRYDGIMVGVNTIISDDPQLTDRSGHTRKNDPLRIVADSNGRTPLSAKILTDNGKTLIATTRKATTGFLEAVKKSGKEVLICPATAEGRVDLIFLMKKLFERGTGSVLIEGGGALNFSALQQGVVDKVITFISPVITGGEQAVTPVTGKGFERLAEAINLKFSKVQITGNDILLESYFK